MSKLKQRKCGKKLGPKFGWPGHLAAIYGISRDVMRRIGAEQFEAMTEDSRQLLCGISKRGPEYGADPKRFDRGGVRNRFQETKFERSVRRSGRSVADWMEEFSRSDFIPALVVHEAVREEKQVQWVSIGNWSNESGPDVARMVELATGKRVA